MTAEMLANYCWNVTTSEDGNLFVHSFVIICMTLVVDPEFYSYLIVKRP